MNAPLLLASVRQAVRETSWRTLALAAAIALFPMAFGPHGGWFLTTLHEGVDPLFDPDKDYLRSFAGSFITLGLPLVFAVRVADLTIAAGARAWRCYALALLFVALFGQIKSSLPLLLSDEPLFPAVRLWFALNLGLEGSIGLLIYGRWRAAQRSARLIQAAETRRALDSQRLQSSRLLALQARVEPQLLFDTLASIGVLQARDAAAADALLADLIALLRAMLPQASATTSNVEREFAVARAWLRVAGALRPAGPAVRLTVEGENTLAADVAPMLVLPLLRAALDCAAAQSIEWDCAAAQSVEWDLQATTSEGRLLIALRAHAEAGAGAEAASVLGRVDIAALRERLNLLHGASARIEIRQGPPALVLDLPLTFEDAHREVT